MHVVRKALIFLVSVILVAILFALPTVAIINQTIGNRDNIKQWLKDSQFYDRALDAVIEQADKAVNKEEAGSGKEFPFNRPEIKAAATAAFSPQFLQTSSENVIDGTFHWLE